MRLTARRDKLEHAWDRFLEQHPVVDRVADPLAQQLHNARHEGFVDLGPVRIMLQAFHQAHVKNGFDLGRDYGRMEMGGSPLPPSRPHLRAIS
jgi:hypothetical protein